MTQINDVPGFFDEGDESDVEFDSQTAEDPVSVTLPDVSRNVNIISNELIPPGKNLLAEIRKESEQDQTKDSVYSNHHNENLERGRGRENSSHSSSEVVIEQGQSSRDTSINMPLS